MKKSIIFLILIVLLTYSVCAIPIGVYVQQENADPFTACIDSNAGDNAYKVLSGVNGLSFKTMENSHIICQSGSDKNFICDKSNQQSIRVILQTNKQWEKDALPSLDAGSKCYNPSTFDALSEFIHYSFTTHQFSNIHYCAKQGDVLGVFTEDVPTRQPPPPNARYTPSSKEICEPLAIKNTKSYINGGPAEKLNNDHDDINNVPKGATLEIKFTLENNGIKNLEEDIQNIKIVGTLENIKGGNDIEDEFSEFDLSAQSQKNVELKFSIPESVAEDSYNLKIEIEGDEDRGYLYKLDSNYNVNVEGAAQQLAFTVQGDQDKRVCRGSQASIPIRITNSGITDETVTVNIKIDALGIYTTDSVSIPKSTSTTQGSTDKSVIVNIPNDAQGSVDANILLEFGSAKKVQKTITLNIDDCNYGFIQNTQPDAVTSQVIKQPPEQASSKYVFLSDQSAESNSPIINMVLLFIAILFVILILLLVVLVIKKNKR